MSTKVITPKAMLSYPYLFKPQPGKEGKDAKYSAALVFPKGTDLKELKAAVLEAAESKWGAKAADGLRSGKLRSPLRTDVEEKGYPEGSTFFNARSKAAPGVVSVFPGPNGKPLPIEDEDQVYAGCWVRASVTAFPYDVDGNRGVGFALNNVQKLADGERIDGRKKAEDEFEADLSAKPAEIDDL